MKNRQRVSHNRAKLLLLAAVIVLSLACLAGCGVPRTESASPSESTEAVTTEEPSAATQASAVEESSDADANAEPDADWAVYLYMCGSDLESHRGSATNNIAEMLSVAFDSENVNVIIQTGGCKKWRDYDISADELSRYAVRDGNLQLIETRPLASMGDAGTFADFLEFTKGYPAKRTALILWDHGGGAQKGACFDQLFSHDPLTLAELREAFDTSAASFDVVGFDCCLMAGLEEAVMLSPYADYLIASQDIETEQGWDYTYLMEAIADDADVETVCKAVCDGYSTERGDGSTISVTKLSAAEECRRRFEDIIDEASLADIIYASNNVTSFGGSSLSEGYGNLVDLGHLTSQVCDSAGIDPTPMEHALDEAVICNGGTAADYVCGLTVFYPVKLDSHCNDYLAATPLEGYRTFLQEHYTNVPENTIEFEDSGFVKDASTFSITLTEDSMKYVREVNYIAEGFEDESFQQLVYVTSGSEIQHEEGSRTYDSVFRSVKLTLNGEVDLFCEVIFNNEEKALLTAPILYNGDKATLRIAFDFATQTYTVVGISLSDDVGSVAVKPEVGSTITGLLLNISELGSSAEYQPNGTITLNEDAFVTVVPAKAPVSCYFFIITDIFGNYYLSDIAKYVVTETDDEIMENYRKGAQGRNIGEASLLLAESLDE